MRDVARGRRAERSNTLPGEESAKGDRTCSGRAEGQKDGDYSIPESLSAFCNIVSFTAANTSRIFVVSVACVKLVHDSKC